MWSWRPQSGVKSCGDVWSDRATHQSSARRRGNSATLPGRARHKPFQPLRREGRDVSGCPVLRYAQHTQSALGIAVHGSQPAPGLPCALVQSRARQRSKARARCAARMRRRVCKQYVCKPNASSRMRCCALLRHCEGRLPRNNPRLPPRRDSRIASAFAQRLRRTSRCANDDVEPGGPTLPALVPRTQRSVPPAMRSIVRFDGALQSRGPSGSGPCSFLGPGSAQQREGRCSASGTREARSQ